MIDNNKNQKDKINDELIKSYEIGYIFENKPINRFKTKPTLEEKLAKLDNLKESIKMVEDCNLKSNSKNIVFNDGDINSPLMIVGEGPGQKEDEMGKPFVGDAGQLLDKMFKAININRHKTYITNVVNYRPPNNRKPEPQEINRYSNFLREHISIIDPKILILMGSTAMESLFGSKLKISKARGSWKELIINNKTYLTMITFHPAYLLRQADQKKYSWSDLKEIRKKIDQLKLNL
jgi:uracil-DNA glycosylase family 4|tara:strand:- start:234 stop:938 length:705 start_codon:yes stop_codon:yes gene_type:complete